MRQPEELLYDFEAVLRLVDHAIADLSEQELSSQRDDVEPADDGDGEPA